MPPWARGGGGLNRLGAADRLIAVLTIAAGAAAVLGGGLAGMLALLRAIRDVQI